MLFEEFLENYNKFEEWNIFSKVKKAFEMVSLETSHKIHNSSITGTDTAMFSSEWESEISQKGRDFIQENKRYIDILKTYIVENFYSLFEWYFERIYVSKFNDFELNHTNISKVDFQVSIPPLDLIL